MDGTTRDKLSDGRLIREPVLSVVLSEYPAIVLALLHGKTVTRCSGPDGVDLFRVIGVGPKGLSRVLRRTDLERCLGVAKKMGRSSPFRSEPESDVLDRIRAHLRVEFADRTDP